jgi:antitoxin Phd
MLINTDSIVSITEANQNFSRIARLVDEKGSVIILKNNSPRYLLIDFSQAIQEQALDNEDVLIISRRIMEKNREAYEALAR